MTPVLEVTGLQAGYGGVPVVRDLSLSVHPGEIVALLGPNGAGKTTTLLSISKVLPLIQGEVRIFGRTVQKQRAHMIARQGVAHVPENRSLFFDLTVRETLRLAVRRGKGDMSVLDKYFPALLRLMDRRAGLLSGGEQQMLALCRGLVVRPQLLMIDELSLGLAPLITEALLAQLREIASDTGCAMLIVEQHADMALAVADRACVLSRGRVELEGTAEEILDDRAALLSTYLGR